MLQMQCGCTRALVASCSRISQYQQRRAPAVLNNRSSSSSSSSSFSSSSVGLSLKSGASNKSSIREKETPQQVVRTNEVTTILDKDFSFFTRGSQESESFDKRRDNLVNLCDEAIILSRTSSDPRTFRKVRRIMMQAARHFTSKLKDAKRRPGPPPDMSYDVYLLRSSWLQVVRTILALVGKDAAEVCSYMMCDYLDWEWSLFDSKLSLKDGTEQLPSPQARQEGNAKMQEERFFHGPFVQDSAVVLYDLFWHLTISDEDVNIKPSLVIKRRTYLDEAGLRRSSLAFELWKKVTQIPVSSWRKPMSVSWIPYPYSRQKFKNSRNLITASMLFQGQALMRSKRLLDCIELWKSGIELCADGLEALTTLLMGRILICLRQTQEYLRHGNIPKHLAASAQEYFMSLYTLLNLLVECQWPKEHNFGTKDIFPNYDDVMQHLVAVGKTQKMLVERGVDSSIKGDVNHIVARIESVLQSYMNSWSDTNPPPLFRNVKICNSILYRLVVGSTHQQPAPEIALKFLRLMTNGQCNLPTPDRATSTILLRAGQKSGNAQIALAVMQSVRGRLLQADIKRTGEDIKKEAHLAESARGKREESTIDEPPPLSSTESTFLLLAEDALRHGDTDRMISLFKRSEGSKAQRDQFRRDLSPIYDISVNRMVFFLYPSLNILRKMKRGADKSKKRTPEMNKVAFDPKILVTILQLIVEQGKTGLAERVWRLIKRASKPKTIKSQSAGWPIPIRAYTIMMNLYALEVKRGTLNSNRSNVFLKDGYLQRRGGAEVHGWGRIRFGPLRNRFPMDVRLNREPTARLIVKQEYQELKRRWESGSAEPANRPFWKAIERVFRRKGHSNGILQLYNEADTTFYNDLLEDISISSSPPSVS